MIPFHEARRRVLAGVEVLAPRHVPLARASGAVLAEPVVAGLDVVSFDNSAMDGYAVRCDDLRTLPVTLPVVAVSSAGHPADTPIGPGQAARILTGAMLVDGADCVVPVEKTDGGADKVEIRAGVAPGANVRRAGEAARRGAVVLERGTVLNPGHLGVAASVGRDELAVHGAPRVAVISTGDELVAAGSAQPGPGQIYESNGIVLAAMARSLGCPATVESCGDDTGELRQILERLASTHDLVMTSGGVSMGGEYDSVKQALAGPDVDFWRIAIKPAKPMGFGRIGDATFFGLPGNPVSAVVAFEVFVRPAMRKMMGAQPHVPPRVAGRAGETLTRGDDGKTHFIRVLRGGDGRWRSTGIQGSQLLGGIASASALAVLEPEQLEVAAGDELSLMPLWA